MKSMSSVAKWRASGLVAILALAPAVWWRLPANHQSRVLAADSKFGAAPATAPAAAPANEKADEEGIEDVLLSHFVISPGNKLGGGATQFPLKRYALLRNGLDTVALRLTAHTKSGEFGTRYEWIWQPDGSSNLTKPNVRTGSGEVFESYKKEREGPTVDGSGVVKSQLWINAGPFRFEWSASDWVYLQRDWPDRMEVAFTWFKSPAELDADHPRLIWMTKGKKRLDAAK